MHDLASQFTVNGVSGMSSASSAQQRLRRRRQALERADADFDVLPPPNGSRGTGSADDEAYRVLTKF